MKSEINETPVDLFAYKRIFSLVLPHRSVCYVSFVQDPDLAGVKEHSARMYEHAVRYQSMAIMTCLAYPVLVSQSFDEEIKAYVSQFDGRHKTGVWYIEHTTLVELSDHDIIHYVKTPFLGGVPERAARKFASETFTPAPTV